MEKLSFDTTTKELLETQLDKVVGQITAINFDDESKSYKATVKFKDNMDVFEKMKDSIVLLTSKLGVVSGNSVCDDENLKIVKMTVDYDPRLKVQELEHFYTPDTKANRIKHELDEMSKIHSEICNGMPEFLLPADLKIKYQNWLKSRNGFFSND